MRQKFDEIFENSQNLLDFKVSFAKKLGGNFSDCNQNSVCNELESLVMPMPNWRPFQTMLPGYRTKYWRKMLPKWRVFQVPLAEKAVEKLCPEQEFIRLHISLLDQLMQKYTYVALYKTYNFKIAKNIVQFSSSFR